MGETEETGPVKPQPHPDAPQTEVPGSIKPSINSQRKTQGWRKQRRSLPWQQYSLSN